MADRFDVTIAGYTLTVETERSAEHMGRLVALVNERVREVQKKGGTANYLHAVMLAAMRLADEVIELRNERERERQNLERKSQVLLEALDTALGEPPGGASR